MSRRIPRIEDELEPEVVAAIAALLAGLASEPPPEPPRVRPWAASGRVRPAWVEHGPGAWRGWGGPGRAVVRQAH